MNIKLLKQGYKDSPEFYNDFLDNKLFDDKYLSGDVVPIGEVPDFPIYLAKESNPELKEKDFIILVGIIRDYFLKLEREIYFNELFWHSFLCLYKREYLIEKYPQILDGEMIFNNIVTKTFNWENYIYKAILAAQYVDDYTEGVDLEHYYKLIFNNLDVFNYTIKYEIFRNGDFLIKILEIIEENHLSKIMKAKIKDRPDLGKDERYGRRVIFEFNKSYPVILSPMLEKAELKKYVLKFLSYYYHGEEVMDVAEE